MKMKVLYLPIMLALAAAIAIPFATTASTNDTRVTPCIQVTKTPDKSVCEPGDYITYTITVYNCGDIDLENVTVVDSLGGPLPYYAPTLAAGASETHDFVHLVSATDDNPLTNCVVVNADPLGALTKKVTDKACASVEVIKPAVTGGGTVDIVHFRAALHCDATQVQNRLDIRWGSKGNYFHLDTLTDAVCTGGNTYEGSGLGTYNGVESKAEWIFTDGGKGGINDSASFKVTRLGDQIVVLEIGGSLTSGDLKFQISAK